jgi:sugar/nucleoside kinase (ribokinase family)
MMQITVTDFGAANKRVTPTGKLDIAGADKIVLPLAALAVRTPERGLVMAAKAIARGNGNSVLLDPTPSSPRADDLGPQVLRSFARRMQHLCVSAPVCLSQPQATGLQRNWQRGKSVGAVEPVSCHRR